jgi:hypothetical protein
MIHISADATKKASERPVIFFKNSTLRIAHTSHDSPFDIGVAAWLRKVAHCADRRVAAHTQGCCAYFIITNLLCCSCVF